MTRIVITGMGACTCVGDTADECFSAFVQGRQGNRRLQHLRPSQYNSTIAYERPETGGHGGRYRSSGFLKRALAEAAGMAGIITEEAKVPVYVGTGLRELRTVELAALKGERLDVTDLDFTRAVREVLPAATKVMTLSNACASSNYALALAMDAVMCGAPMAVAAGCDTLTSSMYGLLDKVNPERVEVIQVFDRNRKGILMGDGGVALIVETEDSARNAGRTPLATLMAVGLSTDAVHETAPDQAGIYRALDDAYSRAGISPRDVDLIYVHGTGTVLNDATELAVLAETFSAVKKKPLVSGLKAMTGHTSGASGAIGVVAAIKSLISGQIAATPGTTDPIEDVRGFGLSQQAQQADVTIAQVNAFGFGGVNSVVLLTRYSGQ